MSQYFWWPRMLPTIETFAASCQVCACTKIPSQRPCNHRWKPVTALRGHFLGLCGGNTRIQWFHYHCESLFKNGPLHSLLRFTFCRGNHLALDKQHIPSSWVLDHVISDWGPQFTVHFWHEVLHFRGLCASVLRLLSSVKWPN